ncbi:MAG: hypothetical protein QM737_22600 [Ferruginibacter sp.]
MIKKNRIIQSENENKISTQLLNFSGVKIPSPIEQSGTFFDRYRPCGIDNQLPYFFLNLYTTSSTHASIINTKADYIIGDGLKFKNGNAIKGMANAQDSFSELITKIVLDYEIFNRFAVEVVYNKVLQPIEYHFVPVWKVRMNDDRTKFWINENWKISSKTTIRDRWTQIPKDASTKIFYFDNYTPSESTYYTLPEYYSCSTSIMVDSLIDKFNLNNIDGHFSVASLITFFMGLNQDEKIKDEINGNIKKAYTGSEGKKIMVNHQSPDSKEPTVQNISSNDWADAFAATSQRVKDSIILGHRIPYLLVGAPVASKLGGGNEKDGDMFRFKNNYIRNRRNQLINAFTQLFSGSDSLKGELEFSDLSVLEEPSDDMMKQFFTVNEIRERLGVPSIQDGDVLASKYQTPTQQPAIPAQQSRFSTDGFNLSEEDFEKIKDMGITADEFEFIQAGEHIKSDQDFRSVQLKFETMDEVAQYLLDNEIESTDIKTLKTEIRKELGINVTTNELKDILQSISKAGILRLDINSDGQISVSKPSQPDRTFEVMYSYDVRPGYGLPIESNTRPFCRKLVENNRFYTTVEIQTMTEIFGYDIFQYGGGWYRDPETQKLTSHCRHYFKANTVTRKRR